MRQATRQSQAAPTASWVKREGILILDSSLPAHPEPHRCIMRESRSGTYTYLAAHSQISLPHRRSSPGLHALLLTPCTCVCVQLQQHLLCCLGVPVVGPQDHPHALQGSTHWRHVAGESAIVHALGQASQHGGRVRQRRSGGHVAASSEGRVFHEIGLIPYLLYWVTSLAEVHMPSYPIPPQGPSLAPAPHAGPGWFRCPASTT